MRLFSVCRVGACRVWVRSVWVPPAFVLLACLLPACLAGCAPKRPDGDSIDVPPEGMAAADVPAAQSGGGPHGGGRHGGGWRGGRDDAASGDPAARPPDYQPLPDALGMQIIASGFDPNAAGDESADKDGGGHYVIPDTQVSYGPHGQRGGGQGGAGP